MKCIIEIRQDGRQYYAVIRLPHHRGVLQWVYCSQGYKHPSQARQECREHINQFRPGWDITNNFDSDRSTHL